MKKVKVTNESSEQIKHQLAAEWHFSFMSLDDITKMSCQIVSGVFDKLDWFDEDRDPIFIRHLTDLVMEATCTGFRSK